MKVRVISQLAGITLNYFAVVAMNQEWNVFSTMHVNSLEDVATVVMILISVLITGIAFELLYYSVKHLIELFKN